MITAKLKNLYSTDVPSLEDFRPEGPFGIYVFAMIGPVQGPGEESFGIMVCTPTWFEQNMKDSIVPGRHHLFVREFDYAALEAYLTNYCRTIIGESWADVGEKIGRLGYWEFEDYRPGSASIA